MVGLAPALLGPRIDRGVHVGSSIQSPSFSWMQSSVWCPWSLWNSQYLVSSLVAGSDFIWDDHLRNLSPCTSRKTCDTEALEGCITEVNTAAAAHVEVVPCDP